MGKQLSRTKRVDRASNLIMAAGVGGVAFLLTFVLAVIGLIGTGIPITIAIVSAILGYGGYRVVKK
jgi:hypothetical protein